MSLNWSFEVILTFSSLVPFLISLLFSFHQYRKTHYQHNFFLSLILIFYLGWAFFHGFSKLLLSKPIYWLSGCFITGYLVSIILFGESLEKEIQISKNLLLVLILQTLIVLILFDEDLVVIETYQNHEQGLRLNHPYLQILIFIEMLLSAI
jgi:hypothetical protein